MCRFDCCPTVLSGISFLALFGLAATDALAAINIWPGGASPCDTTLQACLDGSAVDDTVRVASNGPIDEDLDISKPMSLIAAPGYRPTLAAGRNIRAAYSAGEGIDWALTIDGFSLLQGSVGVASAGGNATITLRRIEIAAVAGSGFLGGPMAIENYGDGHLVYMIDSNRVQLNDSGGLSGITVSSHIGGAFDGSIHDNRVESASPSIDGSGIAISADTASAPNVLIYSNQIKGNFYSGAYVNVAGQSKLTMVSNAITATTADDYFGITLILASGTDTTLDTSIYNNTVVGFKDGIFANGSITGRISGNLLAHSSLFAIQQQSSTLSEDHTLYFANGGPAPTLGTGSMVADPLFRRGAEDARLSISSPAIDAADSAALSALLSNASLPEIDADGLRRFKGAGNLADIGAFEYGDLSAIETVTAANAGAIDNFALNGNSDALPQLTQNLSPDTYLASAQDTNLIGLSYLSSEFSVASEIVASPTKGSAYDVFIPAQGNGAFLHQSSAANRMGSYTQLDNAYVNGHAERIVLATHRIVATPYNRPFGVGYANTHWVILPLDGTTSAFPNNMDFHVYAQDPSLNAFEWTVPAVGATNAYTLLDHPLLNDEPCGRVYATNAHLLPSNPHPIMVSFKNSRWGIFNTDNAQMQVGVRFNIVVDEAATEFCRYDHIFHDGF